MTLRLAALIGSALLALSALHETVAQTTPAIITSPAAPTGTPNNFGRLVARWESRVMIADDRDVAIYNVDTQSFESNALLFNAVGLVDSVDDIDLQSPYAAVAFTQGGISQVISFVNSGGQWIVGPNLGIPPAIGAEKYLVALAGTPGIPALVAAAQTSPASVTLYGFDFFFNAITGFEPLPLPGEIVELAVGDVSNGLGVAVSLEWAGARSVTWSFYNLASFSLEYKESESPQPGQEFAAAGFGDALAVHDSSLWVGSPGADSSDKSGILLHAGRVFRYDAFVGALSLDDVAFGGTAEGRFGRELSADNGICLISQGGTGGLLSGPGNAGFVHAHRNVAGSWLKSDEIYYTPNPDGSANAAFGSATSIGGATANVAFGEPGGPTSDGRVVVRSLSSTSVFDVTEGPGLIGFGFKTPTARLIGDTSANAPLRLTFEDARPSSSAFLVLGFAKFGQAFKGGELAPNPDIILPLATNVDGEIDFLTAWPDVGAISFEIFGQLWVQDSVGPAGFAASRGFSMRQD